MNKAFENYVKNYDMNDEDINYKYKHSYRVAAFINMLAKDLPEEKRLIAYVIGLYHDIGRFKQDSLYNSFYDSKIFDHGDYGYHILIDEGLITKIGIPEKYYQTVAKAVKNHNKYKIENNLNKEELFYAKLVRDADKLDILYSHSKGLAIKKYLDVENDDFKIGKDVEEQFLNHTLVKTKNKATTAEKILKILAFIYDLNFDKSKEYLIKNNILEKIYKRLKHKDKYKKYFIEAKNYLEKR